MTRRWDQSPVALFHLRGARGVERRAGTTAVSFPPSHLPSLPAFVGSLHGSPKDGLIRAFLLKFASAWGALVAHSVKTPILGFGSGDDFGVLGLRPMSGSGLLVCVVSFSPPPSPSKMDE